MSVALCDKHCNVLENISTDDNIFISFKFRLLMNNFFLGITLILKDDLDRIVFSSISNFNNKNNTFVNEENEISFICEIPEKFLNDDYYKIDLITFQKNFSEVSHFQNLLSFKLENGISARGSFLGKIEGAVRPDFTWKIR
jgi:hypothetical protein